MGIYSIYFFLFSMQIVYIQTNIGRKTIKERNESYGAGTTGSESSVCITACAYTVLLITPALMTILLCAHHREKIK